MSAILLAILALPILAATALWAIPPGIGDRLAAAYGSVISGLVLVGSVLLWPRTEGWSAYAPRDGSLPAWLGC